MRNLFWKSKSLWGGLLLLYIFLSFGNVFTSCSDDEKPYPYLSNKWMIVASEQVTVMTGEETNVNITFSSDEERELEYVCTSSNPDVATAIMNYDKSITIAGVSSGKASIKIECPGETKRLSAFISVTVNQSPTRILAIGNSFSQDAVEQYLYELAQAAGIEVVIGNMYIGGCDLDKHLNNMRGDNAAYEYRKVKDGKKVNKSSYRLSDALIDEKWDYISLQQASGKSGKYETYAALADLIAEVQTFRPKAKLMWHQTWAYASTSTHESFPEYNKDQMTMYNAIVSAANQAMEDNTELNILIPSGTAIQNGRTSFLGDAFNRDGYHLEVTYGRYTAACTWFEAIFRQTVVGNSYAPQTIDPQIVKIAQNAAHLAVMKPDEVTDMIDFKKPDIISGGLKTPIYVDFGSNSLSSLPWNNVISYVASSTPVWLKNADGDYTNIGLKVLGGFTGNYAGVGGEDSQKAITVDGMDFPISAWKDGLMLTGTKGEGDTGAGQIEISELDPAKKYNFTILAVRYAGSKDARVSAYKLKGKIESETKVIKTGLKIATSGDGVYPSFDAVPFAEYVTNFENIEPDSNGKIIIEVVGKDTGLAADGHINAMRISQVE